MVSKNQKIICEDESLKKTKMQNSDQKSEIDRYILHIGNEMVSEWVQRRWVETETL